jgi:hypothetical protein
MQEGLSVESCSFGWEMSNFIVKILLEFIFSTLRGYEVQAKNITRQ